MIDSKMEDKADKMLREGSSVTKNPPYSLKC